MTGKYLKVGHDYLLPPPFHFLIGCHLILRRCMVRFADTVVKLQINKIVEANKTHQDAVCKNKTNMRYFPYVAC